MNNRRTAPGGQMTHMLSTILAKVTNIEKLLAPAIHNLPDSEILDSKGVRLLTKMSDRTLLRRRNDGSLPFHRSYPYRMKAYCRQHIIRSSSVTERSLVTTCRLRNVTRSDNNPQGFLIESFTIIENRDIGQYER